MKRLGKLLITFFLIVALVGGLVYGAYLFFRSKEEAPESAEQEPARSFSFASFWPTKVPEAAEREVIKKFSFKRDMDEWTEKLLARVSTDYTLEENDGKDSIKAFSDKSASALYYKSRIPYTRNPFISWDWKVTKFPDWGKESLEKKSEFDFGAQVYVILHARYFLNTKAIQYVWTKDIPKGTIKPSPYTENVMLLVLESGGLDEWRHEERDIRKDFKDLFGYDMEKDVGAIAFMTDSDSTGTSAEAYYSDITLGYLEIQGETSMEKKKLPGEVEVKKRAPEEEEVPGEALVEEPMEKPAPSEALEEPAEEPAPSEIAEEPVEEPAPTEAAVEEIEIKEEIIVEEEAPPKQEEKAPL